MPWSNPFPSSAWLCARASFRSEHELKEKIKAGIRELLRDPQMLLRWGESGLHLTHEAKADLETFGLWNAGLMAVVEKRMVSGNGASYGAFGTSVEVLCVEVPTPSGPVVLVYFTSDRTVLRVLQRKVARAIMARKLKAIPKGSVARVVPQGSMLSKSTPRKRG